MLGNYLTAAFRYVAKNKAFTFLNMLGLVVGMTACLLITQYVMHELSYDDFHAKKERIFRLQLDRYNKGELTTQWAAGAMGVGPDVKANFPEVEDYVRLTGNSAVLSHKDVFFKEEGVYYATPAFFKVFSVPLVEGVDSTVLREPFKIVLSQSLARKYFGNEDPIGKTIRDDGETDYEVSGVFEDLPENTHMKIDALMSYASFESLVNDPQALKSWQWDGHFTYLLLNEKADPKEFERKLQDFTNRHEAEELQRAGAGMTFHLQPLQDIHLDSHFMYEFKPNGDRQTVYFLSIVAVMIVVIAWINYVNLSTAKSVERAREVGVRKVMGGHRGELIWQFLLEAVFFNTIGVSLAALFVVLLTPWFSQLTGRNLGYGLFQTGGFWSWMAALIFGGALLAGLYPAFVLSGFRPVEVLKGRFRSTARGVLLRKGMVVMQFVASIALIVGTFTVFRQVTYMQNQALGVDIDQTLVLEAPNVVDLTYVQKFNAFKHRILQYPEVTAVTAGSCIPGHQPEWNAGGIRRLSQQENEANQYRIILMDHDYIPTFGLKVVAGRGFSRGIPNEYGNVMLNEAAARLMGFSQPEEAINDQIFFWGDTFRIVGVLKNYHQESLKKAYEPLIFRYGEGSQGYYSIRFNTASVRQSIAKFGDEWKAFFPGNPFIYFFLNDHYNEQYQADRRFQKVFGIFSLLGIFIACLGLFGLSSLTAVQRTKEIGVRKVLGASIRSILGLMSRDYVLLLSVSMALAVPIAWWVMNQWLEGFAYRISLTWWTFAIPALAVMVIALTTVSIHTLRAARANPATALRYE